MPTNGEKSLSQERFGQRAQRYVSSPDHATGDDLDRLLAMAEPQPEWIVLDVATGGGHTALKFAPYVAHVIATDITPEMLEAARGFILGHGMTNVEFREADAEALPFDDATFDLVTCRIAAHHFPDAPRFVREAARVCRPGGMLLVQDHLGAADQDVAAYLEEFERLRDPSHIHAFSEVEWRAMFEDAGLIVTEVQVVVKTLQFVPWVERQDCPPETVERLIAMMRNASDAVRERMQPRQVGTPEATFENEHILMAGRKPS